MQVGNEDDEFTLPDYVEPLLNDVQVCVCVCTCVCVCLRVCVCIEYRCVRVQV